MTGYPRAQKKRGFSVSGLLSIFIVIATVLQVFGLTSFFEGSGKSNDDIAADAQDSMLAIFFDPVGFFITLALLIAAIIVHKIGYTRVTKVSLIITVVLFVLSFFRITAVIAAFFSFTGSQMAMLDNESDVREPAASEYVLSAPELISYKGDQQIRVEGNLKNTSEELWEAALVLAHVSDAEGETCVLTEIEERFIAPDQEVRLVTPTIARMHFEDFNCEPEVVEWKLMGIDIDSRSEPDTTDYERYVPEFSALTPTEEPHMADLSFVSITGTVTNAHGAGEDHRFGLEIVGTNGLRLDDCFTVDELENDGSFATDRYYGGPVDSGVYDSVAVLPGPCIKDIE